MVLVLIRVLEMEGDKISVLLLAMHSLHCPVSFLELVMRVLTQHVCFIIICKSLPLSAVVPGHAYLSEYIQYLILE